MHINEVLADLKADPKYADDIERYKKIASITMDRVWA
jgi:hypothetical protein